MRTWRERVLARMQRKEISQADLARGLTDNGLPCGRSAVNRWLAPGKGQRDPSPEVLAAICRELGMSLDTLLGVDASGLARVPQDEIERLVSALQDAASLAADYVGAKETVEQTTAGVSKASRIGRKGKIRPAGGEQE